MSDPRLNRSLVLEGPLQAADGAGGYTRDWQPLGILWAAVKAGTGSDRNSAGGQLSRVPYRIIVRAAPYGAPSRPTPGQRFRDGSRIFLITAVAEAGTDARFLTCHAEEEVAR